MPAAIFYLIYLFVKYPEAVRQIVKKPMRNVAAMSTDALESVDEKVIGNKIGGILNGIAEKRGEQQSTTIKVRCKNCQTLNEESDKFCSNCGQVL